MSKHPLSFHELNLLKCWWPLMWCYIARLLDDDHMFEEMLLPRKHHLSS